MLGSLLLLYTSITDETESKSKKRKTLFGMTGNKPMVNSNYLLFKPDKRGMGDVWEAGV